MFCPNCGNQLKENEIFCTKCGTKVGNTVKKKSNKTAVIISLCVVLIVIMCAEVMFLFASSKNQKNKESVSNQENQKEENYEDISTEFDKAENENVTDIAEEDIPSEEEPPALTPEEAAAEDAKLSALLNNETSDILYLLRTFVNADPGSLLRGESEAVRSFFSYGIGGSYVNNNQPANADELYEKSNYTSFLTEEQAKYVLSSACGREINFDFSGYEGLVDSYIGIGLDVDMHGWRTLEQFSVERIDDNSWKVKANRVLDFIWNPRRIDAVVSLTLTKNPESCFDGYSITGYEENAKDKNWIKTYYDFLTTDPEGIAIAEQFTSESWSAGIYRWNLIYVDNDTIPELYLEGPDYASGDLLLHISKGKVIVEYFNNYGGSYLPYSQIAINASAHMGMEWEVIYRLENGALQPIADWEYADIYPDDGIIDQPDKYCIDGNQVSEAEYREFVKNIAGGMEFSTCVSEYNMSCIDYFMSEAGN